MIILYHAYWCLLIVLVMPFIGVALLVWWPIAYLLGLAFPGRAFFQPKSVWNKLCKWIYQMSGLDANRVLIMTLLVLISGSILAWFIGLLHSRR